ncbi:hypothetical protein [Brevifollis gellanilyticus]|uniref:Bacterial virulence protein VirB8 domain-containing protein n=1 Tax=Brevifollis gellanilyticus TaxID=748831 RepID=A0A512M5T5_9BACT|nr:hypothetical protein [Brevifollis gellanilyticus]GEP42098.1 hypothetical protein BGE01nite_13890 [Brevifollis gellanilyticus]
MPEAAPNTKRRSAIDTLVVRDRTAVFWFLVAIATAAACTWYTNLMSEAFKLQSTFVVMDSAGAYYVPPGLPYNKLDAMHLQLSEMVVETVLERNRDGLVYPERLQKLFEKPALQKFLIYLEKEAVYFRSNNVTQTFELDPIKFIEPRGNATVTTVATGRVRRVSFLAGQQQDKTYDFTITIGWWVNPYLARDKNFPSLVRGLQINDFQKADAPAAEALPETAPKSDAQ